MWRCTNLMEYGIHSVQIPLIKIWSNKELMMLAAKLSQNFESTEKEVILASNKDVELNCIYIKF